MSTPPHKEHVKPTTRGRALNLRARAIARHELGSLRRSTAWLVRSREYTNYTYNITPRNLEHLAWWIANLTQSDVDQVRGYFHELNDDAALRGHIQNAIIASPQRKFADLEVRYGRRAGWYALVRILRPSHIVETGTDKGLGSCVFAAALLRNGEGSLTTLDIDNESGYLISGPYAQVVNQRIGDSIELLKAERSQVDMFIHDSLHSYDHELAELKAVEDRLSPASMVLSDASQVEDSLMDWAEGTKRRFAFWREEPADHWWPGEGIGAAWLH